MLYILKYSYTPANGSCAAVLIEISVASAVVSQFHVDSWAECVYNLFFQQRYIFYLQYLTQVRQRKQITVSLDIMFWLTVSQAHETSMHSCSLKAG